MHRKVKVFIVQQIVIFFDTQINGSSLYQMVFIPKSSFCQILLFRRDWLNTSRIRLRRHCAKSPYTVYLACPTRVG